MRRMDKGISMMMVTALCVVCAYVCCNRTQTDRGYVNPVPDDTVKEVEIVPEMSSHEEVTALSVNSESDPARGHLIMENGDVKLYSSIRLGSEENDYADDIFSKDAVWLVRYVEETATDTMILVGPFNRLSGEGNLCKITVGVDTVYVDISRPLRKNIDLRFVGVLPECRYYRFSKHFELSDRSFPTDFQINIAMADSAPAYIRHFINKMIRDDVARYFVDYSGEMPVYPNIALYNIDEGSVPRMSQYYYNHFRLLYKREYEGEDDSDGVPLGPCWSYQLYAYPEWQSSDGSMITWKFYRYVYMGGAHGGETEFFLTFDNTTGRILGARDFYSKRKFEDALVKLTWQLNAYHGREPGGGYSHVAELNYDINMNHCESRILKETIDGKIYPRPALTRQGMVFSYQTYEKGSNADGVLHFIQWYKYWKINVRQ